MRTMISIENGQYVAFELLAHEMERAQELGADIVCVLHLPRSAPSNAFNRPLPIRSSLRDTPPSL